MGIRNVNGGASRGGKMVEATSYLSSMELSACVGYDKGLNATNVISKPGHNPAPVSPNSNAASRNK